MEDCWRHDPHDRPSFDQIEKSLSKELCSDSDDDDEESEVSNSHDDEDEEDEEDEDEEESGHFKLQFIKEGHQEEEGGRREEDV